VMTGVVSELERGTDDGYILVVDGWDDASIFLHAHVRLGARLCNRGDI
jgi:hypothetical protein